MKNFLDSNPNQECRLELHELIDDYQQGYLTVTGLLKYAINIYRDGSPDFKIHDLDAFCKMLGITKRSFYKARKRLIANGSISPGICINEVEHQNIELQTRDRLLINHFPTALKEVKCPAGRIDLLTEAQIIEVKKISDWKSALGQILVYSAYYPEHKKRIHLFGSDADKEKLLDIELSCSAFDVLVTFELMGGSRDA